MNEGTHRSLYTPRSNGDNDGSLGIGKGGLPHAATATGTAKSFSDTSPWNIEVWCAPYKRDDAYSEHEARRGMAVGQEIKLRNLGSYV